MYVTRPLSMLKRNPGALSEPPPLGPNTGYLVIFDEEAQTYSFFGLIKNNRIEDLPFPQNKDLTINDGSDDEESMFVPVLNQPLSSNRYYVIKRSGKYKGQACTNSREENMTTCLCCNVVEDVKPRPLKPFNDYQQVEVIKKSHGFHAKSIALDGIPPGLLRYKRWSVYAKTPKNYHLNEALGSNDPLRFLLPNFNFPFSNNCSEIVVVGKWYCPFMFVKEEGMKLKEQMKKSVFYKLTLEQKWEKIFSKENVNNGEEDFVLVDVVIQTEIAKVFGERDVIWDENKVVDGVLWFMSFGDVAIEKSIGLSLEVVEGMKWEEERVGWNPGIERQVRVERLEEFGGKDKWKKFSCYVLVESYLLKRMDGKLMLTYNYRHTHQIRCKWE